MATTARHLSQKAQLVRGALAAYLRPKLAQDAKIDLAEIVLGTTALNYQAAKPVIITKLQRATAGKLAKDANISDVTGLLDSLDKEAAPDAPEGGAAKPGKDADAPPNPMAGHENAEAEAMKRIMDFLSTKLSPADMEELRAIAGGGKPADGGGAAAGGDPNAGGKPADPNAGGGKPADPNAGKEAKDADNGAGTGAGENKDKDMVDKAAMDAAVRTAVADAERNTLARLAAVRDAENDVRPWVGTLALAQDSAEAVYRLALDTLGVSVEGVHPSAFKAVLHAQPKPGAAQRSAAAPAMDAKAVGSFHERFKHANRLKA